MDLVDLILSHGLFGHTEKKFDRGRTVDKIAVVQPAPEVSAQEGNYVDYGAAQRKHADLAKIDNSDPGLNLSL